VQHAANRAIHELQPIEMWRQTTVVEVSITQVTKFDKIPSRSSALLKKCGKKSNSCWFVEQALLGISLQLKSELGLNGTSPLNQRKNIINQAESSNYMQQQKSVASRSYWINQQKLQRSELILMRLNTERDAGINRRKP